MSRPHCPSGWCRRLDGITCPDDECDAVSGLYRGLLGAMWDKEALPGVSCGGDHQSSSSSSSSRDRRQLRWRSSSSSSADACARKGVASLLANRGHIALSFSNPRASVVARMITDRSVMYGMGRSSLHFGPPVLRLRSLIRLPREVIPCPASTPSSIPNNGPTPSAWAPYG
jgi:hypothetical protein